MKIALVVAYDGTDFHGFARQPDVRSVQGVLDDRLTALLRAPVSTTGAGRTDAGVHANGQVVSFSAREGTRPEWVCERLNRWLAPEILVRAAAEVPDTFDARFSAVRRSYEYRAYLGDAPDPFRDRFALHVLSPVSVPKMRVGVRALVGEHDFTSYCRRGQGGPVRRVRSIRIVPAGSDITFKVSADSFCHQMVRSIVGMLLEVGRGRRAVEDVERALAARDRAAAGPVAPARGLHFMEVGYPRNPFAR
ncbi:MAG: tRNA pseudouridine(38-40) synthase TruA [Actinomycetota bacterium]